MDAAPPEIRVTIPHALRSLCLSQAPSRRGEICVRANDIRGTLAELARQHPQVYVCLCDERGEPRQHINLFVNDDHIHARGGLDTPLTEGDTVTILPAVSGG